MTKREIDMREQRDSTSVTDVSVTDASVTDASVTEVSIELSPSRTRVLRVKRSALLFGALMIAMATYEPSDVEARSFRTDQFPHGSTLLCTGCHFNPRGGGALNAFGYEASLRLVGGNVDWPALCDLDSDQDGFTNGEELGDPDCVWREGSPPPMTEPTNPGDPNSYPRPMTPDMMPVEDMAPVVDLAPPPDAAPPVDQFIEIWDSSMYDWGEADAFATTEDPWVAPDLETVTPAPDEGASLDASATDMGAQRDQSSVSPDQGAESIIDASVDMEMVDPPQDKQSDDDQSGCQQNTSSLTRTHRRTPLSVFLLLISSFALSSMIRRQFKR